MWEKSFQCFLQDAGCWWVFISKETSLGVILFKTRLHSGENRPKLVRLKANKNIFCILNSPSLPPFLPQCKHRFISTASWHFRQFPYLNFLISLSTCWRRVKLENVRLKAERNKNISYILSKLKSKNIGRFFSGMSSNVDHNWEWELQKCL